MARIRTIKPEFFRSAKVSHVSRDARLLWIGMWTEADDYGHGIAEPKHLAGLFPHDEDVTPCRVRDWLAELAAVGLIRLYRTNGTVYYEVHDWEQHQQVRKPGPPRYPSPAGEFVRPDANTRTYEVARALPEILRDGERPAAEAEEELSRVLGYKPSAATLARARRLAGVRSRRRGAAWFWLLWKACGREGAGGLKSSKEAPPEILKPSSQISENSEITLKAFSQISENSEITLEPFSKISDGASTNPQVSSQVEDFRLPKISSRNKEQGTGNKEEDLPGLRPARLRRDGAAVEDQHPNPVATARPEAVEAPAEPTAARRQRGRRKPAGGPEAPPAGEQAAPEGAGSGPVVHGEPPKEGGAVSPTDPHPPTPLRGAESAVSPDCAIQAEPNGRKPRTSPLADQIAQEVWETRKPRPLVPFPALRLRVQEALDAGWTAEQVTEALKRTRVFTRAGIEFELTRQPRPVATGTRAAASPATGNGSAAGPRVEDVPPPADRAERVDDGPAGGPRLGMPESLRELLSRLPRYRPRPDEPRAWWERTYGRRAVAAAEAGAPAMSLASATVSHEGGQEGSS